MGSTSPLAMRSSRALVTPLLLAPVASWSSTRLAVSTWLRAVRMRWPTPLPGAVGGVAATSGKPHRAHGHPGRRDPNPAGIAGLKLVGTGLNPPGVLAHSRLPTSRGTATCPFHRKRDAASTSRQGQSMKT